MKNLIIIIIASFLITGCSLGKFRPETVSKKIKLVSSFVYPELPELSKPPLLDLDNPVWDVPRDLTKDRVVKNTTDCRKNTTKSKTAEFWIRCGEYPIIINTNIYRGFDYENFVLFLQNMNKIKTQLKLFNDRIKEINRQRQKWHTDNNKLKK